jgi:hypothetical protein
LAHSKVADGSCGRRVGHQIPALVDAVASVPADRKMERMLGMRTKIQRQTELQNARSCLLRPLSSRDEKKKDSGFPWQANTGKGLP